MITGFISAAIVSIMISVAIMVFTFWGYRTKIDLEKTSIYECGFTPYTQARSAFDIKFYLVSLLFIVFDVEILFLFPFGLNKENYSFYETNIIILFIIFIFLGIYYALKAKVLEF